MIAFTWLFHLVQDRVSWFRMDSEPNNIEKQVISGLTVHVSFDLPFSINLEGGPYEVSRGSWAALVHLEQVKQENPDPRLGVDQSSLDLIRDRYGRLRYSRVVIELPGEAVIKAELYRQAAAGNLEPPEGIVHLNLTAEEIISNYRDAAFEEALAAVNRLIEIYRYVADQFHVTRIPTQEIFNTDIQWLQNGESFGGVWKVEMGHGISLQPTPLPSDVVQSIHDWLGDTRPVPLFGELFQDAKDRLDRGDDRQAVIDARTALEVFLDQVLLAYFTLPGRSLEDVGRIIDVNIAYYNIQNAEEALQRASINRKLGHALNEALGLDIHNGNPKLWSRWLDAKELREEGVHRGRTVEHAQAVDAVNCMGEVISEMRRVLSGISWLHDQPDQVEL